MGIAEKRRRNFLALASIRLSANYHGDEVNPSYEQLSRVLRKVSHTLTPLNGNRAMAVEGRLTRRALPLPDRMCPSSSATRHAAWRRSSAEAS
jgi:hypothetical protein